MHLPFDEVPTCYSDTACVTRIPVSRSCRETKKKETYDLQESDCSDSKIIHIKTSTGPCEIKHNYTTNLDHNLSDTNESDSLLFRIRILMLFSPLKTARKQAVTVIQWIPYTIYRICQFHRFLCCKIVFYAKDRF